MLYLAMIDITKKWEGKCTHSLRYFLMTGYRSSIKLLSSQGRPHTRAPLTCRSILRYSKLTAESSVKVLYFYPTLHSDKKLIILAIITAVSALVTYAFGAKQLFSLPLIRLFFLSSYTASIA